jgi:putative two-component system response regulator
MLARTAQGNMLLLHIWRGSYSEGLSLAQQMFADTPWPDAATDQINRFREERHYIRLLLEADDERQALARCQTLKERALKLDQPLATLESWLAEGLTEVQCGRVDAGLSRLDKAVRLARQHPATLADVLQTVAHAYHRAGLHEDALTYLASLQRQRAEEGTAALTAAHARLQSDGIQDANQAAIRAIDAQAVLAELREDATYRVGALAAWLAEQSGMDTPSARALEAAARWHDLGKLFLPYSLVLRPAKLQRKERDLVREHAQQGATLLQKLSFAQRSLAQTVCQSHHERWDGTGYPLGLRGDEIPHAGAIVALADAFDALTHTRVWRPAYTPHQAVAFIHEESARAYAPALVDVLVRGLDAALPEIQRRAEAGAAHSEVVTAIRDIDSLLTQFFSPM